MVNILSMSTSDNNRRNFLTKLAFGTAALATAPIVGSFTSKEELDKKKEEMKEQPIKKVRALGFQWETLDPFLFCVHHEDYYPKGNDEMGPTEGLAGRPLGNDFHIKDGYRMYHGKAVPGFPGHPHRGFETLTVVRRGLVDHADSFGGAGRYGNGDLQWMTAGKGLMHSEMFPLLKKDAENPLELFQIWLNLPKKSKMVTPDYKMFWSEDIPNFKPQDGVYLEVLAGELFGKKSPTPPTASWARDPQNHVGVYNIKLDAATTFTLPAVDEGINRTIYFYEGSGLTIEGQQIPAYHAVDVLSHHNLAISSPEGAVKFLILQGRPISEPVVQHGPFVMNSRQEIQEAFQDYQRDQFGGWPWSRYDQVHERSRGRFARYPDGKEETK
jgi:redox-sensitive bicupin YhaK (pirin superfamily)